MIAGYHSQIKASSGNLSNNISMSGRGRGRGRGNTLPAWMTNNHQNGAEGSANGNHSRNHDDSWESDRGRGEINHHHNNNFVREESSLGMGRGRGRGRGRGVNNRPAWMSNTDDGPSGLQTTDESSTGNKANNEGNDTEMDLLLAQARQKRQQQQKQSTSQTELSISKEDDIKSSNIDTHGASKKLKTTEEKEQEEIQKQRKLEEEAKEAARKMEEEAKRLEQLKEEEEQRQLRALVGDLSDTEDNQMMTDDNNKKRNHQDEDDDFFQFETEEEREERQARKRREERRRKLRKLEQTNNEVKEEDVDMPRNVSGVIQSEQTSEENDTVSIKMEVEANDDNHVKPKEEGNSDDDSFDMFATTDNATPVPTQNSKNATNSKNDTKATAQECDDAEGYYKANIGEIITLPRETGAEDVVRFRVLGIIGKGVFASVIKCVEENVNGAQQDIASSRVVAMKVIRNNEVMARAAAKEMRILRMLCSSSRTTTKGKNSKKDRDDNDEEFDKEEQQRLELENHNIVRLLEVDGAVSSSLDSLGNGDSKTFSAPPPEFRSHCIFLFEYLPHNLREVLNKFGKNVGINLTAVKSYARQLLCALRHLEKHRIVHSDIKPDNILVSANFSTLKLCDFGSAFFETDHDNDPTPYLVSRFYRPPEVILGLEYDRMVDLWSVGVTISELYTGSVLFPGSSNNDMLKKFMDTMGPFSFKMVRRHNASYEKMGLQPHFEIGNTGGTYEFRKQDLDKVTGQPIVRIVNVLTAKTEATLAQVLLKASKVGVSERVEVLKFANFLNRCLQLDPARRLGVRDAMQHEFFQKKRKKEENA